MHVLKLTQIDNSVGVILPKEARSRLKLTKGETVFLTETPDGYALTPYELALDQQAGTAVAARRKPCHAWRT